MLCPAKNSLLPFKMMFTRKMCWENGKHMQNRENYVDLHAPFENTLYRDGNPSMSAAFFTYIQVNPRRRSKKKKNNFTLWSQVC